MGRFRKQPQSKILFPDEDGPEAIGDRDGRLGSSDKRNRTGAQSSLKGPYAQGISDPATLLVSSQNKSRSRRRNSFPSRTANRHEYRRRNAAAGGTEAGHDCLRRSGTSARSISRTAPRLLL